MSVILDALHKARGDKRGGKEEPQQNGVARVLEAGVAPGAGHGDFIGDRSPARRGRSWLAVLAVTIGILCVLTVIGGGFFLLYDQVRRLEQKSVLQATAAPAVVPPQAEALLETSPVDIASPAALPTPLPITDLPVQPPPVSTSVEGAGDLPVVASAPPAAAAAAPVAVNPAPVATPEFKLGSIVCEAGVCVAGLNGRSVRVGDEVRGYKVTQISETAIELQSTRGNDVVRLSQFD